MTSIPDSHSARRTHAGVAQVVAVFEAPRDERHRPRTEVTQRPREQRRRADPIDVIVAMNEHGLGVANGAHETLDGHFRVRQTVR